jgi:hypothetical protein
MSARSRAFPWWGELRTFEERERDYECAPDYHVLDTETLSRPRLDVTFHSAGRQGPIHSEDGVTWLRG